MHGFNWRVRETAHFIFHYLPDSYAADHLPWLIGRAETTWRELRAFVGEDTPAPPKPKVYLLLLLPHPTQPEQHLTRGAYADPHTGEIWAVCRPESPAEGLEEAIGHLVIFQPYAPVAGEVPFLRAGLIAYIMAHATGAPRPERLHRAVLDRLQRGEPVAIFPLLAERSPLDQRQYTGLALSFFTFLAEQYGIAALQAFLGHYDPRTPDQAAQLAYGRPVAALHDEWLATVARYAATQVGVRDFFRRLLPYLRPYPAQIALILVYLLVAIGFALGLQLSVKYLIDTVIAPGNFALLLQLLGLLFIGFVLNALTSLHRAYLTAWVGEQILMSLRRDLFARLQALSASFYARARVGDLVSRMSNDLVVVQMALSNALLSGLYYALSGLLAAITLFLLDWRLAAVVLVLLPLLFVATALLSGRVTRYSRERSERLGDVTDVLQENLNAAAVVRAFGLQATMRERFAAALQALFRSSVRLVLFGSLFGLSSSLVTSLIQLVVLGLGGYLILSGSFSVGALFAFMGILGQVTSPVESFTQLWQALQQAAGSMQRVAQVLDEPVEVRDAPDARELPRLQHEIRFDHVWFSYTGAQPNLQDVSFVIPAGRHVAIVGPSGSGKSTVLNLLLRFYDPQYGSVSIDGLDLRTVTQASLRAQIGVVFQDTFLFNTSIRENLRYGRLDATDAEIEAAARQAEIHDFIVSLPQGYDTPVGERGARLSGGQRQRLALARALLRHPAILLLDEATSALDPETEAQIQQTLARATQHLTTITVTHRLAAAAQADYIFVLDRGTLVEQGTHEQLLAAGGLYARLYEEQQGLPALGAIPSVQVHRLRRVPLFAELPAEALAAIAQRLVVERYAPGDVIVRQGDVGDKLYLIERGQVEVTVQHGPAAVEQPLNTLHEGDYFGEIALLLDVPRTATVRATTAVQLLALGKADFLTLLGRLPALAQRLHPTVQGRLAVLGVTGSG
ncbi:MAG TPA: ABC transporter transmembrane domain-containing protein [Chloroflexota bacterium]|nr:ABC transporter transmembrane domain-containing protein [Chloroflexota bacterium]